MIFFAFSGKYRGAAHSNCNLQYRINPERVKIPVVIHNLKNYDAHLILSAVQRHHGAVTCIPNTNEKYVSFTIGDVTFIDSCQFMLSSLDKLSSNLSEFPETRKYVERLVSGVSYDDELATILADLPTDLDDFGDDEDADRYNIDNLNDYREHPYTSPRLTEQQNDEVDKRMRLMTRKGVYPYEYFNSWEKFNDRQLPAKEQFYSTLTESHISDEDYNRAQDVFTSMEMSSLREYHDFYLLCDVLLLADVFETFRDTCMKHYDLDPAHFYTAPGLSWQAALKMTDVRLELLTDIDQHLFIESGIRGVVSTICHRYAQSNVPGEVNYDESKPIEHLIYWDANNLYGWAMSQYLPTSNFKWLSEGELQQLDVMNVGDEGDVGYILEVDLGKFFFFNSNVVIQLLFCTN